MIDLHSHILPGLDDGVRSTTEACALARVSAEGGVRAIVATPHVRDDYPTTARQMEAAVESVRRELAESAIPIETLPGGELALDRLDSLAPEELARFTLAQTGRYALVEFPYYSLPLDLGRRVRALRSTGITPILAHPERNPGIQESPEWLQPAVAGGALVQLTAASLTGSFGRRARRAATRLLDLRLVHVVASDAHSPRAALDRKQLVKAIRDRGLARYLLVEAPAAIVAGEEIP